MTTTKPAPVDLAALRALSTQEPTEWQEEDLQALVYAAAQAAAELEAWRDKFGFDLADDFWIDSDGSAVRELTPEEYAAEHARWVARGGVVRTGPVCLADIAETSRMPGAVFETRFGSLADSQVPGSKAD